MQKFYDCGIDLGTTNSCIAHPTGDNSCVIIENTQDRMQVTPSSIAIDKRGRMLIGQRARNQENCITCFKRKMGTEDVLEFAGTDISKTPEELSSEILKTLKRDAENRLSEEMNDVVITVPAAFSILQNEATKRAANMAGFRNVILLQEPIAASIAYGATPDSKDQYWMVFDYGGGTLDVSILSTHNGRLTVINSEGDNYCGGSDIDRMLYEKIVKPQIEKEYNIINNTSLERKMILTLESCKIELSTAETALFEEFDSVDNDGNPIEFECEINRKDFESIISDTVDRCIGIARKALEGASKKDGIDIGNINKILLVGGSTFIPLVRNKLKEAFAVELDCSLNPMTVVAEGAAIYSASCVAEVEDLSDEKSSEEPILKIQYEPITSKNTENVVGTVENIGDFKLDKIKFDLVKSNDASGAIWTSGWVDFLDAETGLFDVDLNISPTGTNKFVVVVCDVTGREIKVRNNVFEIKFNDTSLKVSNPPATFSVCVMVTDGNKNILKSLISKNTPLPAEGTSVFTTTKELDPTVEGSIDIHVWEGETFNNPDANNWCGCVHVLSSAMDRILPSGTTIEIKITETENREIKLTGYIPDIDYEIESTTLRDDEVKVSLYERMDTVNQKIKQIDATIKKLKENNVDLGDIENRFIELKNSFDEVYGYIESDSDKVQLYLKEFYEIDTTILDKEIQFNKESKPNEEHGNIDFWADNADRYGDEDQREKFRELKEAYDNADDEENKQYYYDEMSNANFETVMSNFEHNRLLFSAILDQDGKQYSDGQKAEFWKSKAREAIRNHDNFKLKEAIYALWDLEISTSSDNAKASMADIRL